MRTDAYAVLVDFGSTYTKVVIADLRQGDIVLTWREPSTVATDATVALTRCFAKCRDTIGGAAFEAARKLASSSAAGGLRMGVVGLSRSLSTTAGRNAAFGAGAKILGTFCGHLTKEDVAALSSLPLEIVLFCGGYDGGGVRTLRHNAEMLASSRLHIPFVYAGNTAAAADVRSIFGAAHKEIFVSHNITPCVGGMNSAPVAAVIRDLFLHRIINMKGLEKVVPLLDRVVMPTPAAVLAAGKLLAQGTNAVPGMGPLMIVDIGGATTDIHSVIQQEACQGARIVGAPEEFARRTVEGDLGMRESSGSLRQEMGPGVLEADAGVSVEETDTILARWERERASLAESPAERRIDDALARGAVRISARRHAGRVERVLAAGVERIQRGKNIQGVTRIIGTGGVLVSHAAPGGLLAGACRTPDETDVLLPEQVEYLVDSEYAFYAAGLLSTEYEDTALRLMHRSLRSAEHGECC